MATSQKTGLIVHPSATSQERKSAQTTEEASVFGRFLTTLMNQYGERQRVTIGIELIAFPVMEAVAAGIAIVCQKVAVKLSIELTTQRNWQDVANRVHRLLEIGLILEHETPEQAAKAFHVAVVQPFLSRKDVPSEKEGLIQFFFNTSGTFFGQCVSTTTRMRRQLEDFRSQIESQEMLGTVAVFDESELLDLTGAIISMDPNENDHGNFSAESIVRLAKEFLFTAEQYLCQLRALRALPLDFFNIPEDITEETPCIHPAWLNTQILLVALHAPSGDGYLQADDYARAVQELMDRSNSEVLTQFWDRMAQRGLKSMGDSERSALNILLEQCINSLRTSSDMLSTNDVKVFIDLSTSRTAHFTHEEAMLELQYERGSLVSQKYLTDEQLLLAVDWRQVTPADIQQMLDNPVAYYEVIAKGILLMKQEHQAQAGALFIARGEQTKWFWQPLFDAHLAVITAELVVEHGDVIAMKDLEASLPSLLQQSVDVAEDIVPAILTKELLVLGKRLEKIAHDPDQRWNFVRGIMDRGLFNPIVRHATGTQMRSCFTLESWEKFALSSMILICASNSMQGGGSYGDRSERIVFEELAPWKERFMSQQDLLSWTTTMGYTIKDGRRLVKKYSEEEIFRWLYAFRQDEVDQLWQAYAQERDAFYAYWKHQPLDSNL